MSLNRVSYLESWEQNPASFRRRPYQDQTSGHDSDEESASYYDIPDTALSSSFPSVASIRSLRHRLNFNPYAGPSWTQGSAEGANDDRNSLPRVSSFVSKHSQQNHTEREEPVSQGTIPGPQDWPVLETTGAFEVGHAKRILQVCVAVVYCFFAAGIVFGFAAIKPVLIRENVYKNLCSEDELHNDTNVCYEQELRLNLMFTIAAVATNVSALPVGTILDTYGPRVCGIIGSTCIILGAFLFGLAPHLPFDGYIPGYLFLALGGPFIFISSFHLSNTFPTRSGLILSCLTGAFDASSAIFLVFRVFNENTDGSFTSEKFFSIYLIVPLFIIIAQFSVMPATSYKTAGELVQEAETQIKAEINDCVDDRISDRSEGERQRNDRRMHRQSVVSQIQDLLTDGEDSRSIISDLHLNTNTNLNIHMNEPSSPIQQSYSQQPSDSLPGTKTNTHSAGGVWGAMHGFSALNQICSPWFIFIAIFTVLQMLRINYFVASMRQQYEYLFDSPEAARRINETFDILLPVGGLLAVPFIGTILDHTSTPFVLLVLAVVATFIGALGCIPHSYHAGYANIILFVVYRPFYYTAVSDYAAKVFGFQTFGKVYGLIICLAGLGNFAQTGLDALTFKVFHRNPIPVNLLLTIATCMSGSVLVLFVWRRATAMTPSGEYNPIASHVAEDTQNDPEGRDAVFGTSHDGIATRDWEREREHQPLLQPRPIHVGRQGNIPSYGITSSP